MISLLLISILIAYSCKAGLSFLATLSAVSRTTVTYSVRLHAYPSKTGQSKVAWDRRREIRVKRANEEVRQALNGIIHSNRIKASVYPDRRLLTATSIYSVDLTHDLSHARISIAMSGNSVEKRKVYVWMCENIVAVRFALAAEIKHWKRIPTLAFSMADPLEEILIWEEIDQENEELEEEKKARLAKLKAYKVLNGLDGADDADDDAEDYIVDNFTSEEEQASENSFYPKLEDEDLFS